MKPQNFTISAWHTYTKEELLSALAVGKGAGFTFGSRDRERILSNPNLTEMLRGLSEFGNEMRETPTYEIPFSLFMRFERDGNRSAYEYGKDGYFTRRGKLITFALLFWLYGKEEDKTALEDILWAICNEYTWALPAHISAASTYLQSDGYTLDLFASETAQALSETLSLVGDKLTPVVESRVRAEVERRAFAAYKNDFWWKRTTNNWGAVCSGSVGMTAMLMMEDENALADVLLGVLDTMEHFLSGFTADGVCLEGLGYWHYGFGYFTAFATMLKARTAGVIDLFRLEKVKSVALFFDKATFPGGGSVPFSDAYGVTKYALNTLGVLLREYPGEMPMPPRSFIDLTYPKSGCFRFALMLRAFAEAPTDPIPDGVKAGGTFLFPDAGWYITSSADGEITLAAKGGHNDEPHNHNDVGTFAVFDKKQMLLADIGSGEYCKKYFSDKRYEFLETSSRGHSVPIVDGVYQASGREHAATDFSGDENGISMNLAPAYPAGTVDALYRTFRKVSDREFRIADRIRFADGEHTVTERFVSFLPPIVMGECVIISSENEKLEIIPGQNIKPSITEEYRRPGTSQQMPVYLIDYTFTCSAGETPADFALHIHP